MNNNLFFYYVAYLLNFFEKINMKNILKTAKLIVYQAMKGNKNDKYYNNGRP